MKWFLGFHSIFYTVLLTLFFFVSFQDISELDPITLIIRVIVYIYCFAMGVFMWIDFIKYKK